MLTHQQEEILHLHACLLLQYQKPKSAFKILKALLTHSPEYVEAKKSISLAALDAGELDVTIVYCKELMRKLSDQKELAAISLCLSKAYWKQGQAEQARKAYQKYLKYSAEMPDEESNAA